MNQGSLHIGKSGERGYFVFYAPYGSDGAVPSRNLNDDEELRRLVSDAGVGPRSAEDAVAILTTQTSHSIDNVPLSDEQWHRVFPE